MSEPEDVEVPDAAAEEEEPEPQLLQVVYASAASQPFEDDELAELLAKARANNRRMGVTGMLLYHEGSFLQTLEGDPEVVEALLDRIDEDDRHTDVVVLSRQMVFEPDFDSWSMGFYRPTGEDVDRLPGWNDFLRSGISECTSDTARKILLAFREGRWRRTADGG